MPDNENVEKFCRGCYATVLPSETACFTCGGENIGTRQKVDPGRVVDTSFSPGAPSSVGVMG